MKRVPTSVKPEGRLDRDLVETDAEISENDTSMVLGIRGWHEGGRRGREGSSV